MTKQQKPITDFYAWVVEEADGGEAIPANIVVITGGKQMLAPMIGTKDTIEAIRERALALAAHVKRPLKLVRFHQIEVVERISP